MNTHRIRNGLQHTVVFVRALFKSNKVGISVEKEYRYIIAMHIENYTLMADFVVPPNYHNLH